jgi:hypothetical protein
MANTCLASREMGDNAYFQRDNNEFWKEHIVARNNFIVAISIIDFSVFLHFRGNEPLLATLH